MNRWIFHFPIARVIRTVLAMSVAPIFDYSADSKFIISFYSPLLDFEQMCCRKEILSPFLVCPNFIMYEYEFIDFVYLNWCIKLTYILINLRVQFWYELLNCFLQLKSVILILFFIMSEGITVCVAIFAAFDCEKWF